MNASTPETGLLLLDGAQFDDATDWLLQHYGNDQPQSLFKGTAYEPIASAGPFILNASRGDAAHSAWWSGSDLQQGVWLGCEKSARQMLPILQRRLRIFDERKHDFWLRLADGPALGRAWMAGAQWPAGFWHGVDSLWLRQGGTAVCAWVNQTLKLDCAQADKGLAAQITLPDALLHALNLPANTEHPL